MGSMAQPVPWSTGAHLTSPTPPPYHLRQWVPAQLTHTLVGHTSLPLPSGSLYKEIEVQGKLMEKQ